MSAAAESAGAAARVARGQQRVEAEAGHQDGQQGEAQPPLAQLAVRVITGTNVVICNQSMLDITIQCLCRYLFIIKFLGLKLHILSCCFNGE